MEDHPSGTRPIRERLLAAMKTGKFSTCGHLPRESVLAEMLGISRTQLRDILASLEREGFITRRHGVGTIINHHVLNVPNRMDIEIEFLDMIRRSGFEPAIAFVRPSEDTADENVARRLKIPAGTPILRMARLCTADGKPAVYCEDIVERSLVKDLQAAGNKDLPFFRFLKDCCGIVPYMDLTDLHPAMADKKLAKILEVAESTPLLYMDEVDFDIDGRPVFCSDEYFVDGIIHLTTMRKKL